MGKNKMLTLATTTTTIVFSAKKTDPSKKLKKFGKRLIRERRNDLARMGDRVKEIARDEERRTKELLKEHREFFEKKEVPSTPEEKAIDFFEK